MIALACAAGAVLALAAGVTVLTVMRGLAVQPGGSSSWTILAAVAGGLWLVSLSAQSPATTNSLGVSPSDLGISNDQLGIP